jgi:hypothetical protein
MVFLFRLRQAAEIGYFQRRIIAFENDLERKLHARLPPVNRPQDFVARNQLTQRTLQVVNRQSAFDKDQAGRASSDAVQLLRPNVALLRRKPETRVCRALHRIRLLLLGPIAPMMATTISQLGRLKSQDLLSQLTIRKKIT